MLPSQNQWGLLFAASAVVLAAGLGLAIWRGWAAGAVSRFWAALGGLFVFFAWIGITAQIQNPVRSGLRRILSHWAGSLAVVGAGLTAGVALLWWALQRIEVSLVCMPRDVTVLVDGVRRIDACTTTFWASSDTRVLAGAPDHEDVSATVGHLPVDPYGRRVLALRPLDKWRCAIRGGQSDDLGLFLGCGVAPGSAWTRSRTWRVDLSPRTKSMPATAPPRLVARARNPSTGVAILPLADQDDCYSNADSGKDPHDDQIDLRGCGRYLSDGTLDRYEIEVTVCATGEQPLTEAALDWIRLFVRDDGGPHEPTCQLSR